jgi:hypothetical protein
VQFVLLFLFADTCYRYSIEEDLLMKNNSIRYGVITHFLVATTLILSSNATYAEAASEAKPEAQKDWTTASGLLDAAGVNINETSFMKNLGLTVGGWLESSVSANFNRSEDGFNGTVTFHDRTGEVQVNQAYLWLQKAVTVGGDKFDFGGRVDFMYGTDAIFTQAYGTPPFDLSSGVATTNRGHWDLHLSDRNDRFYGIALPQAYAEFNLPFGNGIDVKVGHFYTPIGYEVVTAPDNLFVTHAYTMQYGEPFTHTGILSSYTFNPNWSIKLGAVTGSATGGWDGSFDRQLGNWNFLGGGTWTSNDAATTLTVLSTIGSQSEKNNDLWAFYSVVGTHNFTDKLHYIIQHDHGFADNILIGGINQNTQWYGINQYLTYDVHDKVTVGLRAEWFSDPDGFRIAPPGRCGAGFNVDKSTGGASSYTCAGGTYPITQGSDYYAATVGLNYKPAKWLSLRPNLRYDYSTVKAFDSGDRRSQLLFTADMVITF